MCGGGYILKYPKQSPLSASDSVVRTETSQLFGEGGMIYAV